MSAGDERRAFVERASLNSGGALHTHLAQVRAERRKAERERRKADRATVGRRIGDLASAILLTNRSKDA